ncbi:class I SAM-dependent methyltransferase [Natronoglomus mannanivorans]|uniref:Class I SAM-dependent methyltransferase n=1 Tax=Natronoglomus mannanivorans TaxID=2979990 RepID=A0AAP3DZW2_9EURY|nr:class I SAM-dependent methyltransferase [Halobacteria archaeon AArc-xg1-1]
MGTTTHPDRNQEATDAVLESLLEAAEHTLTMDAIYVGHRLGYYDALWRSGPITAAELAAETETNERYAREWLEHGTVVGLLECENPAASGDDRRYDLPESAVEVFCDPDSENYLAPIASLVVGVGRPIEDVLEAFRTGGGVPFEAYGDPLREGQAAMNRPGFLHQLGPDWLASIPDVDARLREGGRVADIGCGHGWSSIGLARHYPDVTVDGVDLDRASIERARENAIDDGLEDRVRFHHRDAADLETGRDGEYDLAMALECVHDLSDPVGVLETMRRLVGEDGTVLVVDERTSETFTPEGNEIEALLYGFSVLHCLPAGMADRPSAETGTVMRESTLRAYATDAGFETVEVLPIEHFFFRFYRLEP